MDSKSGDPSDLQNDPNQDLYTDDREPQEMDMEQSDEDIASHHDAEVENGSEEIKQHRLHDDNYDDHHQKQQHHHHHRRENHSQNHHHHRQHDDTGLHERFDTNIIQVTNISPSATLEQIYLLFGFLGDILHVELYQSDQNPDNNFKVCFVEFAKSSSVLMAQHLTNTVFIDRGLVVVPYNESSKIPDRDTAIASVIASNLSTKFNCGVVNQATTATGGAQVVATIDPRLTALGLPQYPQLPINTDPARIEEIRRTVYIGNLDSTLPPDQVLKFFNGIGEVKYIRMAGDDTQPTRFAFVEFTHQSSVANALQQNGFKLGSRPLKINHSNNAIVKPQLRTDIDDGSKKARDIRSTSRDLDSRDRHSSRYTGGRDRERDRDRDRYHDRRLSRDYKQSRRSRSRDRDVIPRRRSRSRERVSRRSRSRDKISRRRSRSRDSKRRRSVSRSRERSKQKHHKSSRR